MQQWLPPVVQTVGRLVQIQEFHMSTRKHKYNTLSTAIHTIQKSDWLMTRQQIRQSAL